MQSQNLLVELGTEELPPKALGQLAQALSNGLEEQLNNADLSFDTIKWLASPRRLAVKVNQLAWQQQDKIVEKRGPAIQAAFDKDGRPTKAALGWARGNGISVEQAETLKTDKGEWLLYKATVKGQNLEALIEEMLNKAISKLPIPKPMRWGSSRTEFIRPVHTVCVMYADNVLPVTLLGKSSSNQIQGHRFHGENLFTISHADEYEDALASHNVIVDFDKRKQTIREQIQTLATQNNAQTEVDEELLEEVTALVEWPVALVAEFEEAFLSVPKEALIYTMKGDQKYFPLVDQSGSLKNKFIFISNIDSKDPKQVISGNEKVIRPRLSDAEFFFKTDKKHTLEQRIESLDSVVFQQKLGTLKEKSERISKLASHIATQLQANPELAGRAGLLCKTDLMTNMVGEFPDIQGVMGMHYARHDGEPEEVAVALNEQYMPRFAGDNIPTSPVSCALAIADKIDTLVGIFGIGMLPKGDKDPFALRRAAIGVIRLISENGFPLDTKELVEYSLPLFGEKLTNANVTRDVIEFVIGRCRALYQDKGVAVDVIQSVVSRQPTKPTDFAARIEAVSHFRQLEDAEALAAANKRVSNILAKHQEHDEAGWQKEYLHEPAEIELASALEAAKAATEPFIQVNDYHSVLNELASLRAPVDAFFDSVMVMTEDMHVRTNRLALLNDLRHQFLRVADISVLN